MRFGRGALGVAAVSGVEDSDDRIRRMLEAAPHRGDAIRLVRVAGGALGVSGDAGVEGLQSDGEWAVAFAGVIDEIVGLPLGHALGADETASALLGEIRSKGALSVARRMRGSYSVVVLSPDGISYWRDQMGFASLFHRVRDGRVWVASEPKQVVAGAGIAAEPDLDAVIAVFLGDTSDATPSALNGVDRVPRRTFISMTALGSDQQIYWDPNELLETSRMDLAEFSEVFAERMDVAVRRMMRGPDAVSLSGGVDSPVVASYAAPAHRELFGSALGAVSNVYPDHPSVDETPYISLVADRLGLDSHLAVPTARPTDDLEKWVGLFDGPYPVVSVSESAEFYRWSASLGYSVVLTGEIAEFLMEMSTHTLGHLLASGRVPSLVHLVARERDRRRPWRSIAGRTVRSAVPDPWMGAVARLRRSQRLRHRPPWMVSAPPPQVSSTDSRTRWDAEQLNFFGGSGVLLEAHDTVTSLCRVDVRRPFADVDMWEAVLALRAEVKHGDPSRKSLLRHLARNVVPDEILDRREKTVFDESLVAKIDYVELQRWLVDPRHRLPWIDYPMLADRIASRSVGLVEFMWMKDLAAVHAYLDRW